MKTQNAAAIDSQISLATDSDTGTDLAQDAVADAVVGTTENTTAIENSSVVEWLEVVSGVQTGASVEISSDANLSIGSGYENDIVLRCKQTEVPVKLKLQRHHGSRRVQLLEGQVSVSGVELTVGEWRKLAIDSVVSLGDSAFVINSRGQTAVDDTKASLAPAVKIATRRSVAMASMGVGAVLLMVLGVQGYWSADASQIPDTPSLQQRIADLGFENLVVVVDGQNEMLVQGRVNSRDDFQKVQQLLTAEYAVASLDVQIDVELVDRIEDIYRNHGATATVAVIDQGHVRVESEGVDEKTIMDIEAALSSDLPALQKLEAVNTPLEPEDVKVAAVDPDKEVEAIVAGDVSYVVTRDQARYFVGSVLPSGHTIKSITDGTVVMLLQGKETQLNF